MLKAPFPYFGGKSRCADTIWRRFGDVRNYVEPFFGSGAVLLQRPDPIDGYETVNDLDGMVANFWRALQNDPDCVAHYADWPVNENDLHARHAWLVTQKQSLQLQLEGDPDYYDAKIAGWWVWGISCWIGGGFCSGKGAWSSIDGELVKAESAEGIARQRPHLSRFQGVNSQRASRPEGITRGMPYLNTFQCVNSQRASRPEGVDRKRPHLLSNKGIRRQLPYQDESESTHLQMYLNQLAERLRNVRVCCGDWSRVCGHSPTVKLGMTAVFLDPPYADTALRCKDLYSVDDLSVAHDVRKWAIENGDNPMMRICLAGYEGEHQMPDTWECYAWRGPNGYADNNNRDKERLWFSPHCIKPDAVQHELVLWGNDA